jgi:hypothetical protein
MRILARPFLFGQEAAKKYIKRYTDHEIKYQSEIDSVQAMTEQWRKNRHQQAKVEQISEKDCG